ncbi:bacterioferritin-associated ferredoxin [Kingella potus]|uniref:Bacterioferritin-associated ferredoxin n=1 Tax=Kingella potus TaxID=265175 RepID=A0A377R6M8_9NEIS|nr:(2Fe-2S)-binding protein [Kingella potus]UOO99954.1 (2Fe-2S)-binding protein [Kingella potus]STR03225.1 bacterioferritin-associated ferredoxin [Kingella potus]
MFVCICNAITDHQIKETVAAGASTLADLQSQLGVATCCGCCTDLASSFLTSANNAHQAAAATPAIRVSD